MRPPRDFHETSIWKFRGRVIRGLVHWNLHGSPMRVPLHMQFHGNAVYLSWTPYEVSRKSHESPIDLQQNQSSIEDVVRVSINKGLITLILKAHS